MNPSEIKKTVYFACSFVSGIVFVVSLSVFLLTIESNSASSIFWAFISVPISLVGIVGIVLFTSEFYMTIGKDDLAKTAEKIGKDDETRRTVLALAP